MIALICAVLTAGTLLYVFYFHDEVPAAADKSRLDYLRERKEVVYENLRDLNFDYKAGKVPPADYESMHAALEDEAVAVLAEIEFLEQQEAQYSTG